LRGALALLSRRGRRGLLVFRRLLSLAAAATSTTLFCGFLFLVSATATSATGFTGIALSATAAATLFLLGVGVIRAGAPAAARLFGLGFLRAITARAPTFFIGVPTGLGITLPATTARLSLTF